MRTVILQEFVSLDGLAAGPDGDVAFVAGSTQNDRTFGEEQMALMNGMDTILLGRVTYELFAGHWPNVTEGPEKEFAHKLNATPKVVFSRTLDRAPWGTWDNVRLVRDNPADEVARLKQQPGGHLVIWGSLSLAQSLIAARVIDEYRLVVCPVVLGEGRALFAAGTPPIDMTLLSATPLERGAVSLKYAPRQAGAARAARS